MRRVAALAAVTTLAAALGCGSPTVTTDSAGFSPPATTPPATAPPAVVVPLPQATDPDEVTVTGEVPDDILAPVLADATARTGTAADALEIRRAEQVQWPDGALGCPQPGQFYTQAIVPGYHVELTAADGTDLDYRIDDRGRFQLCASAPFTRPG